MALKKMRVSFDIDIATFVQVLAAGNHAMHIDVFGDGAHSKPPKLPKYLNGHTPKLLEGPKQKRGKGMATTYATILAHMATNKDRGFKATELVPIVVAVGKAPNSASPQINKLRQDGLIKRDADGLYRVTPKGIARHEKQSQPQAEG